MDTSVEYLVEASAAEAETISAAIAAAKARKINGDVEQIQDSDDGVKAVPTGKQNSTLIMPESAMLSSIPHGVRLHHRAVRVGILPILNLLPYFNVLLNWLSEF